MTETTMKIKKDDQYYTDLVNGFLVDSKLADVDILEKKRFLSICVINKLNPFKNQIYAVPRNIKQQDGSYKKGITPIIDYHVFIERAENSGLLSGWRVEMQRTNGAVSSGKITIYRKDRHAPFEYEADVADFIVYKTDKDGKKYCENPIRTLKPEVMLRKQLIRIGFSLCFPENCRTLDPEIEVQPSVIVEVEPPVIVSEQQEDLKNNPMIEPMTADQDEIINTLYSYLAPFQERPELPSGYDEANMVIEHLKLCIGKKYIREDLIILSEDEINSIFAGDSMKAIKKEALKHYKELAKK